MRRPGSEFDVVPWAYGTSCARVVWTSESWVRPGSEVVFLLGTPRAASSSTYDVLGWHSPYPTGEFLPWRTQPRPPSDRSEWLNAREYFELVRRLPISQSRFTYPDSAEAGIRVFEEGPPEWSSKFPGYEILRSRME